MKPIILCIDDEILVLHALERLLQKELGNIATVELADNGEDALLILQSSEKVGRKVAVMICDMIMPGISGSELINVVSQSYPEIRNILLTGQAGYNSIVDVINKSMLYRFVAKPWDNEDLMITIREALNSWQQQQTIIKQNYDLQLFNKELETRVQMRTSELEKLSEQLNIKNNALVRQEKIRRRLLANISHDLRTPIMAIQGYSEAVMDGVIKGSEQQEKYLKLIHSRITSLNEMIGYLFELSRLESGSLQLNCKKTNIVDFCSGLAMRYQVDCAKHEIKFSFKVKGKNVAKNRLINIDCIQFERVINNLINNAIQHTDWGGKIDLDIDYGEKEWIKISVSDSGRGIADDDIDNVFERLWRSDKARTFNNGNNCGLGLAIVKEIVEMHSGKIEVTSRIGKGAKFLISLPVEET